MANPILMPIKGHETQRQLLCLNRLSSQGLMAMFDAESRLFCERIVQTPSGFTCEGLSHRYTLIALLGLQRLEAASIESPVNVRETLNCLLKSPDWIQNLGDLGLLIWLCSLAAPERLGEINSLVHLPDALTRFPQGRQRRTMELAWFLAGLAHWGLADSKGISQNRDLAMETYRFLKGNQGETGLFSHLSEKRGFSGLMRGRMGSFADQIYPIYALAKFSQAYGIGKASERALDCALTVCELQGPLGQWWWHYDAASGKVLERYPVYSVHQDGMAPMALLALGEAVGSDFNPWIFKGLQWIYGENELEEDMCDSSANVIWRSIYRTDYSKHLDAALALLSGKEDSAPHKSLCTLRECRPYHLGWLLYAWVDFARGCGSTL